MLRYILRRLLVAIPTLFAVITLTFFMMHAAPGGPFTTSRKLPPEIEKNIAARYGLDKPVIIQYRDYLLDVAKGDFGPSLKYINRPVMKIIKDSLPTSLKLGLSSLILSTLLGILFGVIAALRHNRWPDYTVTSIAVFWVCVPTFVTGPIFVLIFATKLHILPIAGIQAGLKSYILPVAVLTLPGLAVITRLVRGGMIEALNSNFVRTARAKGLPEWRVVTRHALRPAILPLISFFGPACAAIVTGSLVTEKIFQMPGIGRQFFTAAIQRDYTVVMAIVILYATVLLVLNLVGDLMHAALDPKVRLT